MMDIAMIITFVISFLLLFLLVEWCDHQVKSEE